MAKEIKLLSGSYASATTASTIYTVPSGRLAKVTCNYFVGTATFTGAYPVLTANDGIWFSGVSGNGINNCFPVNLISATNSEIHMEDGFCLGATGGSPVVYQGNSGVVANTTGLVSVHRSMYLPGNATITVFGKVNYSFLIVEEY